MKTKIDLAGYKKVTDHPHFAVLEHPKGHQIRVAKRHLSKSMQNQLDSLPIHKAKGGDELTSGDDVFDQEEVDLTKDLSSPDFADTQPADMESRASRVPASEVITLEPPKSPFEKEKRANLITPQEVQSAGQEPEQISFQPGAINVEPSALEERAKQYVSPEGEVRTPFSTRAPQYMPGMGVFQGVPVAPPPSRIIKEPETQKPALETVKEDQEKQKLTNYRLGATEEQATPPLTGMVNPYEQVRTLGQTAAYNQYQADLAAGRAEAAAAREAANAKQALMDNYMRKNEDIQKLVSDVRDDIKNTYIKPNQYFENLNVPQKIANAIGMIIGGKDTVDFINKQIDRDVEAQKANLGKNNTILEALLKETGNLKDATNLAAIIQKDIYADKLRSALAATTNPAAKARLANSLYALENSLADKIKQSSTMMTLRTASPSQLRALGPEAVAQIITPDNQRSQVAKELAEFNRIRKVMDVYKKDYDYIQNSILNGTFSPIDTQSRKNALVGLLTKELTGRFNFEEAELIKDAFYPKRWEWDATTIAKRQRGLDVIKSKLDTSTLEGLMKVNGINPDIFFTDVSMNPRER